MRDTIFYRLVLLVLAIVGFSVLAYAQEMASLFSRLTVDEGLSHTDATGISQDRKGYMWIATTSGLNRYDGYTVKNYYDVANKEKKVFDNRIRSLFADNESKIWLATEAGIRCFDAEKDTYINLKLNGKRDAGNAISKILKFGHNLIGALGFKAFELYRYDGTNDITPLRNIASPMLIYDMVADAGKNLWLYNGNAISKVNADGNLTRFNAVVGLKGAQNRFTRIFINNDNRMVLINKAQVFTSRTSIYHIVPGGEILFDIKELSPAVFENNEVLDIKQDPSGNYWVCTKEQLLKLDAKFNLLSTVISRQNNNDLISNELKTLFIDRSACLWVCSKGAGVSHLDLNAKPFHLLQKKYRDVNGLSGNRVTAILEQNRNTLWIGSNTSGIDIYNLTNNSIHNYTHENSALGGNKIGAMVTDNNNLIWIGHNNGISVFDIKQNKFVTLPGQANFPQYGITTICADYSGRIWAGSIARGLCMISKDIKQTYTIKYYREPNSDKPLFDKFICSIYADKERPELFVTTTSGLYRLVFNMPGDLLRTYHYAVNKNSSSISSNYLWSVQRQNDSLLWVGAIGGGLNKLILDGRGGYKASIYNNTAGFFNDVESVVLDEHQRIWMSGRGLQMFDPRSKKLISFDKNDGLQGNGFKVGSSHKGASGRLYFGGVNGLNYFFPDSISFNKISAKPAFTDLYVNDRLISVTSGDGAVLQHTLAYSRELTLNYLQNNFSVNFSAMHYANPSKCRYRYKLVDVDKQWQYVSPGAHTLAYSNLDYGRYKLILEASNNDDVWGADQAVLMIHITPPWWKSVIAKIIYAIIMILIIIGVFVYQARQYELKREIAINELNDKKKEEIQQLQLQFFVNIMHEFRTPLSLIIGPLENMVAKVPGEEILRNNISLMYRNAQRLMNLINELMDFRKTETGLLKLQIERFDLDTLMIELCDEFDVMARQKNILFKYHQNHDLHNTWIDRQVVTKIISNLLFNSFKYTGEGGTITTEISKELSEAAFAGQLSVMSDTVAENYFYIKIKDNGIGIAIEDIHHIFERYFRLAKTHLGSGIGLAFVKSLTLLHKGNIHVSSEPGKGTEIMIAIPYGREYYADDEMSGMMGKSDVIKFEGASIANRSQLLLREEAPARLNGTPQKPAAAPAILIVDDNPELRDFLKTSLDEYQIISAKNGMEGLKAAKNHFPDLIISDVMMPVMSGIEFCKQVKNDIDISHIFFIMLSARDALDAQIEGVESGADMYLAKPFSIDLLKSTVKNIFDQKNKLRQKYARDYQVQAIDLVHSAKDKSFMDKLLELIYKKMENTELDVNAICRELLTNRTDLYKKIKSITGQSLGEFIRTVRLKKAVEIMIHEDVPFSEIVFRVGIESQSYFSRAFKREYGKTPSQYLKEIKQPK